MGRKKGKKKSGVDNSNKNSTYLKAVAVFKCSKDNCNGKWTSMHAWERDEKVFCDNCGRKTPVDQALDENLQLDQYNCSKPKCGNHWECIHNSDENQLQNNIEQECDFCGTLVKPSGIQERFGRHYWFVCPSEKCGVQWEDFSLTQQKTQRCSKPNCGSRGDIIRIEKRRVTKSGKDGANDDDDDGPRGGGGGRHNAEFCDMCADMKRQGLKGRCLPLRRVDCKWEQDQANGEWSEKIVKVK